jgi:hypothetical protein
VVRIRSATRHIGSGDPREQDDELVASKASDRVLIADRAGDSAGSGTSAARVSRTGLPLSQLSAAASISLFATIASATALSTSARSVAEASPHASFAACAASEASSPSAGIDCAS